MTPNINRFGIYLNPSIGNVVRITSPYWLPSKPEWVYVTNNVNETLLNLREVIEKKSLSRDPHSVTWVQNTHTEVD